MNLAGNWEGGVARSPEVQGVDQPSRPKVQRVSLAEDWGKHDPPTFRGGICQGVNQPSCPEVQRVNSGDQREGGGGARSPKVQWVKLHWCRKVHGVNLGSRGEPAFAPQGSGGESGGGSGVWGYANLEIRGIGGGARSP